MRFSRIILREFAAAEQIHFFKILGGQPRPRHFSLNTFNFKVSNPPI